MKGIAMIDKIRIQNFKCLRDVEVELGPLNVLIGPNDSGKSSFLQAVKLLQSASNGVISANEEMIWNKDKRLPIRMNVTAYSQSDEFIWPPTRVQILNQYSNNSELSMQLAPSEIYRLNPTSLRKKADASNEIKLSSDGSNLASVLHALLIGAGRQEFLEIEQEFCKEVPTLKEVSMPLASATSHCVEFKLNQDVTPPVTISSNQISDGAMLLLAYLVIARAMKSGLLLIEEPENGLHPSRLKLVVEYLRRISTGELGSKPRQVIITTHSPLLLNLVRASDVRIFRRDTRLGTEIKAMDKIPNIDRLSKDFAPGDLWSLFGEDELVKGEAR
jgi:predicted ATPase